jgi:hypothetical protein
LKGGLGDQARLSVPLVDVIILEALPENREVIELLELADVEALALRNRTFFR